MADVLKAEQRSRCMAAIKGKDTKPEIAVRAMLDTLKVKYELHRSDLSGKPDIVLPKQRKIIFVHGCFWHLHACRYGTVFRSTTVTALKRQPDGSWKVGRVLGVLDSPLPGAK